MAFALFNLATLSAFIPHGHCYLWKPELIGLHLVSDALIALAYYSITITLFYFVRKRQDLPFRWAFILFAIFIIACGTTHLMAIWTLWHPTYWVAGALKAITAIASVSTAILLLPIIPQALALPSPTQLEAANRELQAEITKRQQLEKEREGFFNLSPDLLCITTFDGYFQYMNPAWETETGFTTEELLANPYINVFYPDDRAALVADAQKVMAGIDTANYESRIQCKTGSPKWIAWSASAAPAERLVYVVGRNITQRKQIEENLRESETQFRRLIQDLHVGVLLRGPDAKILFGNREALKLLGLSEDQLLGKTSFDADWSVVHKDGSPFPDALHPVPVAIATRQPVRNVVMGIHRPQTKDLIWLLVNAEPHLDGEGNLKQVICTFTDISDRKQMEELLLHKTAELEAIFRAIPDAIVFTDTQRCIQSVNPALTRLFDYQPEEVFGQKTEILYASPGVYQEMGKKRYHPTASEQLKPDEVRYRRKNYETFISETVGSVVKDSDGRTIGFIAVIRDITERKQTEERLKLQSIILKNITGGICLVRTSDGGIAYTNPKFEKMFGYDPGELDGKHVSILNYQYDRVEANEVAQTIMATIQEQGEFTYEVHNIKKDGTPFWCQATSSLLEHPEYGTVVVAVQYDISDRKHAEAERQTLMLKLLQSNRELEQFALIASHDLKEPLRSIRNFCSLLQSKHRDSLNEKGQDYLNRIQNATQRMQALINDLLSLSQVSTQAKSFLPVDLAKVFQEVTSGLQKQLQQTGGRVEVENLPTVDADSTQLSQLFQNLISNALKFHRDVAPVVKISSQFQPATGNANDRGFHQIMVEDNGIGFDEKYRDRIFETFERLHGRGEYEGTGIGLAICKKIVERHGGNITVRSILGHGSTFIITLPIS